jgi:hypothetical protein
MQVAVKALFTFLSMPLFSQHCTRDCVQSVELQYN